MASDTSVHQLAITLSTRLGKEACFMSDLTLGDLETSLTSSRALVRCARNARQPINALPTEILAKILQYAPITEYERTGPCHLFDSGLLRIKSVIVLAHVCRLWREIALNLPTLWNRICDTRPQTRVMFLRRSASVPLSISLKDAPSPFMTALLQNDSGRFRELHWNDVSVETLKLHATFPAPNLEVLTLHGKLPVGRRNVSGQPVALFGGRGAPRLRVLSLDEIYCLPANQFPLLTSLHINDCFSLTVLLGLMHLLRSSPLLVDICLEDPYEESRWDGELDKSSPPSTIAHLDRSRRVVFEGLSASSVNWILSRVVLSPEAAVRITRTRSWPSILSVKLLDLPMMGDLTRLSIDFNAEGDLVLIAVGSHTGIRLQMAPDSPEGIALLQLPDLIPTRQIRELWIGKGWTDRIIRTPLKLHRFLSELSPLDVLVVHDGCIGQVVEALKLLQSSADSPRQPRSLQVIVHHATATSILEALSAAQLLHMHILIAYHPRHPDPYHDDTDLELRFKSVTYTHYEAEPQMQLPVLCTRAAFEGWPSLA